MSDWALARLRQMWRQLEFDRVIKVTPGKESWNFEAVAASPNNDIERSFTRLSHSGLDLSTLGFYGSPQPNQRITPIEGDIVCGWPEDGDIVCGMPQLKDHASIKFRLENWFIAEPEFELLVRYVFGREPLLKDGPDRRLLGGYYREVYYAIALLVFYDDVQPFINVSKPRSVKDQERGIQKSGLPMHPICFVHSMAYALGDKELWTKFERLAHEQGLHSRHDHLGHCQACIELGMVSALSTPVAEEVEEQSA